MTKAAMFAKIEEGKNGINFLNGETPVDNIYTVQSVLQFIHSAVVFSDSSEIAAAEERYGLAVIIEACLNTLQLTQIAIEQQERR
jgi:hypothetical protein